MLPRLAVLHWHVNSVSDPGTAANPKPPNMLTTATWRQREGGWCTWACPASGRALCWGEGGRRGRHQGENQIPHLLEWKVQMGSIEKCPSHSRSQLSKQAPPPPPPHWPSDIHRPGKRIWPSSAGNWPGARQDCQRSPSFFLGVLAMAALPPLCPHASLRLLFHSPV